MAEAPPHSLRPEVEDGYQVWLRDDLTGSEGLPLVEQMRAARLRHIEREHPDLSSYQSEKQTRFEQRWQRAERYHS